MKEILQLKPQEPSCWAVKAAMNALLVVVPVEPKETYSGRLLRVVALAIENTEVEFPPIDELKKKWLQDIATKTAQHLIAGEPEPESKP
jgi:hypothetical protein